MTLDQWSVRYGVAVCGKSNPGCVWVTLDGSDPLHHAARRELYCLDDYFVSTASGPTYWMVPCRLAKTVVTPIVEYTAECFRSFKRSE